MSSIRSAGAGTIPDYGVASAPAIPGSLSRYTAVAPQDAATAGAATGFANPQSASVYEAYYGPPPAGLQGVDVMGHIARTNLTLPAYYQVRSLQNGQRTIN